MGQKELRQYANVVEVSLGSGLFLELDLAPFFDELGGGEGGGHEDFFTWSSFALHQPVYYAIPL